MKVVSSFEHTLFVYFNHIGRVICSCKLSAVYLLGFRNKFESSRIVGKMPLDADAAQLFSDDVTIKRFRQYLRFDTVKNYGSNHKCAEFLRSTCEQFGFAVEVIEPEPGYPIVFSKIQGTEPNLPGLLLNSHYDVVPAAQEAWHYPAFGASMNEQGDIFARGTQDMKSVGMQYLEALGRLKQNGVTFKRNLYLLYVPDEENGGVHGMGRFIESEIFEEMNIGFVLDEGLANPTEKFSVFNGERSVRMLCIDFVGNTGHGSRFIENSCGEKITRFLQSLYSYRQTQLDKLNSGGSCISLGEVSTVNLTMARGGLAYNVVPPDFHLTVDFRLATDVQIEEFEAMLDSWVTEAGPGVTWRYCFPDSVLKEHSQTQLDRNQNEFWDAFLKTTETLGIEIEVRTFPAATDSRNLRLHGLRCIGFSPINKTPILLHDHNEFLNKDIFLKGIDIYKSLITAMGNC